jgi:hypothetical protein
VKLHLIRTWVAGLCPPQAAGRVGEDPQGNREQANVLQQEPAVLNPIDTESRL